MTMNSTWVSDKQYADIEEFIGVQSTRNFVQTIQDDVLKGMSRGTNKTLLDIGAATGHLTKILSKNFGCVDVIEPNTKYAKDLAQFNVSHDTWQEANIEKEKYDLIIAAHVLYHIPRQHWDKCLMKAYDGLKPGGSMVVPMAAPRGQWEMIRQTIMRLDVVAAAKPDSTDNDSMGLIKVIQKLKLANCQVKKDAFKVTGRRDEFEAMSSLLFMFAWSQCKLEGCISDVERTCVENEVKKIVAGLINPTNNTYTLVQEEDVIIIQKPQ